MAESAANDPWFYKKTDVESVINNAPFNSNTTAIQKSLTNINNALGASGTINTALTGINTALGASGTINTALTDIKTALTDQNAKSETLIQLIGTNGNMSVITYLDELRNASLDIKNAVLDNKDELTAIKTGITALPASFTALAASNQTSATTLAGGLTGFGKSLTDGLSSLGSALYNGLNSVGSAVGAKITDLNTALKTTQSQLASANSALSQAQTALTQAQAASKPAVPVAVTVSKPPKTTQLDTAIRLPARATGGPALGWTLVGEDGPELVRFPLPVQVHSNGQTKSILQNSQDQSELIDKLQKLIELQAQTIATLQQQGRNQSEQLDGLHREFARFGGKVRLAA
jgi:chaperonin cofactor prefoldin